MRVTQTGAGACLDLCRGCACSRHRLCGLPGLTGMKRRSGYGTSLHRRHQQPRFAGASGGTNSLGRSSTSYRSTPAKCRRCQLQVYSRHTPASTWATVVHGKFRIGVSADTRVAALRSAGSAMLLSSLLSSFLLSRSLRSRFSRGFFFHRRLLSLEGYVSYIYSLVPILGTEPHVYPHVIPCIRQRDYWLYYVLRHYFAYTEIKSCHAASGKTNDPYFLP